MLTSETGFEIAIVGMAGRFPGADNLEEFWHNLRNGVESLSFFFSRGIGTGRGCPGTLSTASLWST